MLCVLIPLSGVDSAIVSGLLVCRRTPLCHCPNVRLPVKTAFQRLPVFHHNCTLARTTTRVHCSGCIWLWSDQIHDQDSDQTRSTIKRSQLITNAHMSSYLQHFWTGQNYTFLDKNKLMIFLVWTVPRCERLLIAVMTERQKKWLGGSADDERHPRSKPASIIASLVRRINCVNIGTFTFLCFITSDLCF